MRGVYGRGWVTERIYCSLFLLWEKKPSHLLCYFIVLVFLNAVFYLYPFDKTQLFLFSIIKHKYQLFLLYNFFSSFDCLTIISFLSIMNLNLKISNLLFPPIKSPPCFLSWLLTLSLFTYIVNVNLACVFVCVYILNEIKKYGFFF